MYIDIYINMSARCAFPLLRGEERKNPRFRGSGGELSVMSHYLVPKPGMRECFSSQCRKKETMVTMAR